MKLLKNLYKFCRVIGELDIKLDLVPPSLMNFISRQIVGKGFKLYKKVREDNLSFWFIAVSMFRCSSLTFECNKQAAGSVAKLDEEDFSRALADPLYINIRHAMYSTDKAAEAEEMLEASEVNGDSETKNKYEDDEDASENEHVPCRRAILDIEESVSSEERNVISKTNGDIRRQFSISPEVEQALGTLDRVINMVRNITPVQEDKELPPNKAEDQTKQISLLEMFENVPQKSHSRDFSTSMVMQDPATLVKKTSERKRQEMIT